MKTNYQYPIEPDWSAQEITVVTDLYRAVEDAYELPDGVNVAELLGRYASFRDVVGAKATEKRIGKRFEQVSGYSIYKAVTAAKASQKNKLKMM